MKSPQTKTSRAIKAALCEQMRAFHQKHLGYGPRVVCVYFIDDLLLIRLRSVLTVAEQHLIKTQSSEKGRDLLKHVRTHLIEMSRDIIEATIIEITGIKVVSLHHDISTVTGEEVLLFTLAVPFRDSSDES